MLEWMLYVSVVSFVLAAGAVAGERSARLWGLPSRWIWCGALAGSIAIATFAWLVPATPEPVDLSAPVEGPAVAVGASEAGPFYAATTDLQQRLPDLDRYLRLGWLLLSVATLAGLAASARGLHRQMRGCVEGRVNGRRVLLSDRLGPAVVGFIRPKIVLPRWVLEAERQERELILAHEEEHVFAGDQRLVALSLLALVAAPWNLPLWWKLRRMRQAIEIDCDQRVLRGGRDVGAYGNLILRASRQPSVGLGYGSPFGEPAVSLERRISAMVAKVPRYRSLRGVVAGSASVLLVLAAFAIGRPSGLSSSENAAPSTAESLQGGQDGRVAVNQVATAPDRDANPDQVVLEVKTGPAYFMNRIPVASAELKSFVASIYAPRPRKVLFVQADPGVSAGELAAAVDAARQGMIEALDEEKRHGGPGASATVNVVRPPAP